MKNFIDKFLLSLSIASLPAIAFAWGTPGTPSTIYTKTYDVYQVKSARTSDGKTYISWAQPSDKGWSWGYDLFLQLLDEDGNPLWDEEGFAIENRLNATWSTDYSLVVTPNGDAVVSWADARSEESDDRAEYDEAYGQEPVIYRINQNHEFVWDKEGITFGDQYTEAPILYVFGNDVYVVLISINDYDLTQIVRLNDDGTFAFEPKDFASALAPSEGTDFIAVYSDSEGTVAMRYDRDLNPVWDKAAVVSEYMPTGWGEDPYIICPDGQGGIAVTFTRELDFTYLPVVNHISAEGEATFGQSADVVPEDKITGDYDYPIIAVNQDSETIFTAWSYSGDSSQSLGAQLFDFFGERMFDENGVELADKSDPVGYSYGPIAVYPIENDAWFVCYADELSWDGSVLHFACYDKTGDELLNIEATSQAVISDPSTIFEDNVFTLVCLDDNSSILTIQYEIDLSNVGVSNINNSGNSGITEIYSIDGSRVAHPAKGLNIVRKADGTARKIIVK